MSNSKADALGRIPLFAESGRKELEYLASKIDEVGLRANQTLIKQGDANGNFFILLEGEAAVKVDGTDRPPLKAGDFFGEISMIDRGQATATVVTTTPGRALVMSHPQFRDAISSNDVLLSTVMAAIARRLRRDSLGRGLD